eukprot:scaffold4177_cov86-Cyclotella_meneghiniana.AAC.6
MNEVILGCTERRTIGGYVQPPVRVVNEDLEKVSKTTANNHKHHHRSIFIFKLYLWSHPMVVQQTH